MTIHVISHTHWDREWYRTNQEFRVELVQVVDAVMEAMQRESSFRYFTLDGQSILIEDYLSFRPEQEERVEMFVRAGRLLIGPWYTQPDEFLVSGESVLRNLLAGIAVANEYGGAMPVGWVPDTFGHISQLPQILSELGIRSAALTRGIGNELPDTVTDFIWESPNGSEVTVVHQVQGYYSGGLLGFPYFWGRVKRHAPSLEIARERLEALLAPYADAPRDCHVALWNGADHVYPEPHVGRTLRQLEELMPDTRIVHSSVMEYLRNAAACAPDMPRIRGELRGSRYHPLLPSILSTRIYLKERNARAQRTLERIAEPACAIAALASPLVRSETGHAFEYPQAELREAWKLLLQNHGHDSIGGCSIDQVHREMLPRFDQSEQISGAVSTQALEFLTEVIDTSWAEPGSPVFMVFNPKDRPDYRLVEHEFIWSRQLRPDLSVEGSDGAEKPTQLLSQSYEEYPWLRRDTTVADVAGNLWWWGETLARMDGVGIHTFTLSEGENGLRLHFQLADLVACRDDTIANLVELIRKRDPAHAVEVRAYYHRHRLMFESQLLPLSLGAFRVREPQEAPDPTRRREFTVGTDGLALVFAGHRLTVNRDASFRVTCPDGTVHDRLALMLDEGDSGDTYDFQHTEDDPIPLAGPGDISVEVTESGPVRASLAVTFTARLPVAVDATRRRRLATTVELPVQLAVWVEMGSDTVHVSGTVANTASDHRIRVHFPAPSEANRVISDGQFSVEARSLDAPDTSGWVQQITGIRPHQSWVGIGGSQAAVCVFTDGLHEHEVTVTGTGRTLGITLLRSVGWLSRGDLTTRRGQAGPMIRTPEAQCQGTNSFRYGFRLFASEQELLETVPHGGSPFVQPVTATAVPHNPGPVSELSLLSLADTDFVLTALMGSFTMPGATIARFYNASLRQVAQEVQVSSLFTRATRVTFDERPRDYLNLMGGKLLIRAEPHEIITILLEPTALAEAGR